MSGSRNIEEYIKVEEPSKSKSRTCLFALLEARLLRRKFGFDIREEVVVGSIVLAL